MQEKAVARILNLIDDADQNLLDMTIEEARGRLLSGAEKALAEVSGSFALVARDGERVAMARSLDRPLRYFLAKEVDGPMLVVADRIDAIRDALIAAGYDEQFHPSYTRMVPAHHVTHLRLIGCPDPNPVYRRFFAPPRAVLPADLDLIGELYVGALAEEVRAWLQAVPAAEPLGVLFSGGVDSGAVLLTVYRQLLALGHSPSRLKAFTLAVAGGGSDVDQARRFLAATSLEMLGESIEVSADELDPLRAIEVIEDYKPRDVECATALLALLAGIRRRYPDWRLLVDGDGGDENLKDYPIEENPELTIKSVVNNSMLYQEGWGVEAIKHSLTYSGGQSRGCVRTYAPARRHGFESFSPFTRPSIIQVAEAIPFAELTGGDHQKLYGLKGEVLRRGIRRHFGIDMPVFPKRRFQHGAMTEDEIERRFAVLPDRYRMHFLGLYS